MKVSAYILCYNNQETILQAVDSVKNQTLRVDELFVIDADQGIGTLIYRASRRGDLTESPIKIDLI